MTDSLTAANPEQVRLPTPFRPDSSRDFYLASFPRSGNTWLRTVLFHIRIGRAPVNLAEVDLGIPDSHLRTPLREMLKPVVPTERHIVKSHAPYILGTKHYRVANIVRDPRDVIPSFYRYKTRMGGIANVAFQDFAAASVMNAGGGCWFNNTRSWQYYQSQNPDRISIIRYEDLVSVKESAVIALASILELPNPEHLAELLGFYNLHRMRELEGKGNRVGQAVPGFIGSGQAADDQRNIVDEAIRTHARYWLDLMGSFGYNI